MTEAPQGVKISAYIFFAQAALTLLGMCGLLAYVGILVSDTGVDETVMGFAIGGLCFVILFLVLYGAVGYGLLNLQSWARIGAIILAILSLCSFPVGTILGAIVLYFMFQPENVEAFQ